MPNNIQNKLVLIGPQQDIDKIVGKEFSFSNALPPPSKNVTPRMQLSLTDWFVLNWGTKWDVWNAIVEITKNETIVYFVTAWSPPNEWVENAQKKFPNVKMSLVWVDVDDYPSSGYCNNTGCKDVNTRDFVKKHFLQIYNKEEEFDRLAKVAKQVTKTLAKKWHHRLEGEIEVEICGLNCIVVAVWLPNSSGYTNCFNDLAYETRKELQQDAETTFEAAAGITLEREPIPRYTRKYVISGPKKPANPYVVSGPKKRPHPIDSQSVASRTRSRTK